ncbi:MAG: extracellular solute-binding protein [Gemmatimonadaceae bacterium]
MRPRKRLAGLVALASIGALAAVAACDSRTRTSVGDSAALKSPARQSGGALVVMNAAAATLPLRAVLDSFTARTGIRYEQEPGASLEVARRITEAGRRPDVVLLADPQVFPALLMPRFTSWYALMGRNRIVLAYTEKSRGAGEITADNWRRIILEPAIETGRADPNLDPSGYRTLLVFQLAERFYQEPGLAQRLLEGAPTRNVRPREADQVALLQAHELDYIWTYENLARNHGLRYVKLPNEVDLGTPADSATYATATTRVLGKRPGDTLTMRGAPILFAVSVLDSAAHRDHGERFVRFLTSVEGRAILRAAHFDALDAPIVAGSHAPTLIGADSAR